jgi:hypothetical protein
VKRYIIQRVLATVPVMFIVGSVVFIIMHLTPGDPATIMAGDLALPEQIEKIRAKMGFDKPLITQYRLFFGTTRLRRSPRRLLLRLLPRLLQGLPRLPRRLPLRRRPQWRLRPRLSRPLSRWSRR